MRLMNNVTLILIALCLIAPMGLAQTDAATNDCPDRAAQVENDEKALVQILIFGLSTFYFEPSIEYPERVTAYFASAENHHMKIRTGEKGQNGILKWSQNTHDFSGSTVRINSDSELCITKTEAPGSSGYPSDQKGARDARWILNAHEIDDEAEFTPHAAKARLFIDGGALENCAFVSNEYYRGTCKMKSQGKANFNRAISEAMVVRFEVDKPSDRNSQRIVLIASKEDMEAEIEAALIDLDNCADDDCVKWGDREYRYVYDVVIHNSPEPNCEPRTMMSNHGRHLRDMFEGGGHLTNWDVAGVRSANNTYDCCDDFEPLCWKHFKQYEYQDEASSQSPAGQRSRKPECVEALSNPPACPLVGYP